MTSRSPCGSRTARAASSATSPAVTRASRRRRSTPPPAAAARGWTTSGRPRSGPGGGSSTTRARGGQDKGQRAELAQFVEASLAGAAMPIPVESLVATTRATIAVRREPAERPAGAGMSATGTSRLGWYARRAGQDVARRGGVARTRPGAPGWPGRGGRSRRSSSPRRATPPPGERAVHRRPAAGHRRAGARGGQGGHPRQRGPAAARRVGGAGRRPDRPGAARLVPRPGDRPPVRSRTATPSASITARRSRSATSSRSGRSPGCSTSRCWPRPGSSPVTSSTRSRVADQLRSWWRENPFLSGVHWTSGIELGIRLISLAWIRRLLDDWPGVGRPVRARRARACGRSAGTSSTSPRSPAAAPRPTIT